MTQRTIETRALYEAKRRRERRAAWGWGLTTAVAYATLWYLILKGN